MKYRYPLKQILERGRPHWDRNEVAPTVRRALEKVVQCRTPALGLQESTGMWVPTVFYSNDQLMKLWRSAVVKLLRTAYRTGRLRTRLPCEELEAMLKHWAMRWWSVKIQSFESREHFLRYVGRYVRRPPIAQRRITSVEKGTVTFWAKDKKLRRRVFVQSSVEEFIDAWVQHIPARYKHSMRYFGLFAPRAVSQKMSAMFAAIGQARRLRPKRRPWVESLKRDFGVNPLIDSNGNRMHWVRRLAPKAPQQPAPTPDTIVQLFAGPGASCTGDGI